MTEVQELVRSLTDRHGRTRESLLPILQGVVAKESYLSDTVMTEIAKQLDISAAQVFGTATFYSFLDTEPRGKYVIRICKTITCDMHGKRQIAKAIEDLLKIKAGETTTNKKFTLLEANCLGWCHEAPAMLINDTPYTKLTPEKVLEILTDYMQNK
ncbi:MAG TPA: NADH-quinone oxidoreductase subunit NuoE [Bacteroidales bacterium]|nr:NADH-quinone oxidoreductase subunit NuoE [Bacteroidales bacterium]